MYQYTTNSHPISRPTLSIHNTIQLCPNKRQPSLTRQEIQLTQANTQLKPNPLKPRNNIYTTNQHHQNQSRNNRPTQIRTQRITQTTTLSNRTITNLSTTINPTTKTSLPHPILSPLYPTTTQPTGNTTNRYHHLYTNTSSMLITNHSNSSLYQQLSL